MMKLYIIVDHYLDQAQKGVQSIHAAMKLAHVRPELVGVCAEANLVWKKTKDLESWAPLCDAQFREPYWNNKLTALAAYREEGFAEELPLV